MGDPMTGRRIIRVSLKLLTLPVSVLMLALLSLVEVAVIAQLWLEEDDTRFRRQCGYLRARWTDYAQWVIR
jgi:hypothetical protein